MLLMTLGTVAADLKNAKSSEDLVILLLWVIGLLLCLFLSLDYDRYRSWKLDNTRKPLREKALMRGIILPDFLSAIIFTAYQLQR